MNRLETLLAGANGQASGAPNDTLALLRDLAAGWPHECPWQELDMLCRKLSVAGEVRAGYGQEWRKIADEPPLGRPGLILLAGVLASYASSADGARRVKWLDGAFKARDLAGAPELDSWLSELAGSSLGGAPQPGLGPSNLAHAAHPIRSLPLTVLVSEGPQARAYLTRLRRQGWLPRRLIVLATGDPRKPLPRWLPSGLRRWLALAVQDQTQNYWPRKLSGSLSKAVAAGLSGYLPDAEDQVREMVAPGFPWALYGKEVERVLVRG
ncbi:MAG: hypothetical protein AB1758_36815, partial [Candidatus Eremiobacterota bacterium]